MDGFEEIYVIATTPTANTFTIVNISAPFVPFSGVYLGGSNIGVVSNTIAISKQWNPYVTQDRNVYLAKIDFGVEATAYGQVTIDYQVSSSTRDTLNEAIQSGTILGTGVLETFPYPGEQDRDRLWHPVYFQADGQCVQITIRMSDAQITNPLIAYSDLQIEGMALYTMKTSSRLQ
jgi:hypothetical protein